MKVRYRRALAACGFLTLTLASATGVGAQTEPPTPGGQGRASAAVSRIVPGFGGISAAIGLGTAIAEVTNQRAQAQSATLDAGFVGLLTTVFGDSGCLPVPPGAAPPAPATAENSQGDAEVSQDTLPVAGSTLGAGRQHVAATTAPAASATTTVAASQVDGLVTVGGGRADTSVEITDGARRAHATVDVDIEIADLISLTGLHWEATHTSGRDAEPAGDGIFTLGAVGLGPLAIPLSIPAGSLDPLEATLNQALGPVGIRIDLPAVEHQTEPTQEVRVTPLRITLGAPESSGPVVEALLEATLAARTQLYQALIAANCAGGTATLLADIALLLASGNGSLAIEIGGVRASTGEATSTNPFGSPAPLTPPPEAVPSAPLVSEVPAPAPAPALAPTGVTPSPAPDIATTTAASTTRVACTSTNPVHWPPCSRGVGVAVGLLGLAGTTAMAGADGWYRRRRSPSVR